MNKTSEQGERSCSRALRNIYYEADAKRELLDPLIPTLREKWGSLSELVNATRSPAWPWPALLARRCAGWSVELKGGS